MKRKSFIVKNSQCVHCRTKEGSEHAHDCVCRTRTVVVEMTVEYIIAVPEDFNEDLINFCRNESSACVDHAFDVEIPQWREHRENEGYVCLCPHVKTKYVREATREDHKNFVTDIDLGEMID